MAGVEHEGGERDQQEGPQSGAGAAQAVFVRTIQWDSERLRAETEEGTGRLDEHYPAGQGAERITNKAGQGDEGGRGQGEQGRALGHCCFSEEQQGRCQQADCGRRGAEQPPARRLPVRYTSAGEQEGTGGEHQERAGKSGAGQGRSGTGRGWRHGGGLQVGGISRQEDVFLIDLHFLGVVIW